jgi:hypothetical protein
MKDHITRTFEISLPVVQSSPIPSHQSRRNEVIKAEVLTTDQILLWSETARIQLRQELEALYSQAFSNMSKSSLEEFVCHYFRQPVEKFQIYAMFFRNQAHTLIATSIFVYGEVTYEGVAMKGAQIIVSAVMPKYQDLGIGQTIGAKILMEWQPDVLFTTCAQSSALYSRIGLVKKSLVTGFEVYPRLEKREQEEIVVTVPYRDLGFAVSTFSQTYLVGFAKGNQQAAEKAMRNLTVLMARKEIDVSYDFDPWNNQEREDKIAKALGVGANDGILVMFRKTSEL